MAKRKLNPAQVVINELGIRPLARELGVDPTIVSRWKKSGLVPSNYHQQVLRIAAEFGRTLTTNDLVYGR
jgi:hypothetical protein